MNWTIQYSKGDHFVRVGLEGTFNAEDYQRMIQDIISQDYWRAGMSILFDNRKLDYSQTNYEVMRKASSSHQENDQRIGGGKIALLMKSLTEFGLGRQYEILTSGKISADVRIFRDEADAVNWLSARIY